MNREIHICHDYVEAVFNRMNIPLDPEPFEPNWSDRPLLFKIYQGVERIPLPLASSLNLSSMAEILRNTTSSSTITRKMSLDEFATLLFFTHSLLNRRLAVSWQDTNLWRVGYPSAIYGRGTASGGGLYPTEIYWAVGPRSALLPGLYHYDNAHHALERLVTGDVTGQIRSALFEHPAATATDQFLLISVNFWKSAIKYANFTYHLVTQDVGVLLSSLHLVSNAFRSDLPIMLWYHDEAVNKLLGLETLAESVFAVVPLPLQERGTILSSQPNAAYRQPKPVAPLVSKESIQRSQRVLRFPLVERVHRATLIDDDPRPDVSRAYRAECPVLETTKEFLALPPPSPDLLQDNVLETLQKRRSSHGRFSSYKPLSRLELATLLSCSLRACNYITDVKPPERQFHFIRLMMFINNVEGIVRGVYAYDGQRHGLLTIHQHDFSLLLQQSYKLHNYNPGEAAVMITIVGRPDRMLEIYGNRGYRILNAEVGFVAHNIYMISTALSLGCGAVLGFDNRRINRVLELEESDQRSLLFCLVGYERPHLAEFNARLVNTMGWVDGRTAITC